MQSIIPAAALNCVDDLFVSASALAEVKSLASELPKLQITSLDMQWLQVLSEGWATPIRGFMKEKEYLQCQHFGCLLGGVVSNHSVPIVLPLSIANKERLEGVSSFTLTFNDK